MINLLQNNPTTFQTSDMKTIIQPQGTFKINNYSMSVTTNDNYLYVNNNKYYIPVNISQIGGSFWLSSIAMIIYADKNKNLFKDKRILELGCGIGLPGMYIAANFSPKIVVLSDREIDTINLDNMKELHNIKIKQIEWDVPQEQNFEEFDIVIASDCIYRYTQDSFLKALKTFTSESFIIINPYRECFDEFIYKLQEIYDISIDEVELCFNDTYVTRLTIIRGFVH